MTDEDGEYQGRYEAGEVDWAMHGSLEYATLFALVTPLRLFQH